MSFTLNDEQQELGNVVRDFLTDHSSEAHVRRLMSADPGTRSMSRWLAKARSRLRWAMRACSRMIASARAPSRRSMALMTQRC